MPHENNNQLGNRKSIYRLTFFAHRGSSPPVDENSYANPIASADAFRWAIASIEIIGLTPEADGNEELSIT